MKQLFTIIFTLITNLIIGQNLQNDSIVNKYVKGLIGNGVDTILIYEDACVGCTTSLIMLKDDSCFYIGRPNIYTIFWKLKGIGYASKVSNYDCYKYDTIPYNIESIWELYFQNKTLIKKERILDPYYVVKKDTVIVYNSDHYSYSEIRIIDKHEIIEYEIADFFFNKIIEKKFINKNYKHNINLVRKKLQIQIENTIKNIENKKLIKRTAYNTRYR